MDPLVDLFSIRGGIVERENDLALVKTELRSEGFDGTARKVAVGGWSLEHPRTASDIAVAWTPEVATRIRKGSIDGMAGTFPPS